MKQENIYQKIDKIVDIILNLYPAAKLFGVKGKIMSRVHKVPEPTLKHLISRIKNILEEE